jgi:TonB family protein
MIRSALAALVLLAVPLGAQNNLPIPPSIWLEWRTLRMVLAPDSTGVRWWVTSGIDKDTHAFSSRFNPQAALAWTDSARAFFSQTLTDADTGSVRRSPTLVSTTGDGLYAVRRKAEGRWSSEWLIVMEELAAAKPLLITGDDRTIGPILDSLAVISRRTRFSPAAAQRAADAQMEQQLADSRAIKSASARTDNHPPRYPIEELQIRQEGRVLLSFYIGTDGRAERSTIEVLHATTRGFLDAVLLALPTLRFHPAEREGRPVRQQVMMPFQFSLSR